MPYLAARRRFGSLAGAALGLGIALLLPVLAYGFSGNLTLLGEWWRTVTETTAPNLMDFNNVSAASVFARWLGPGPTASVLAAAARPGAAWRRRSGVPDARAGRRAGAAGSRPAAHDDAAHFAAGLGLRLPALDAGGDAAGELRAASCRVHCRIVTTIALCAIGFSIWDVIGRPAYQRFMHLSMITICYLVVIGALAVLRQRRVALRTYDGAPLAERAVTDP